MEESRLLELFNSWKTGIATQAEERKLMEMLADPKFEQERARLVEVSFDGLPDLHLMSEEQGDAIFQNIIARPVMVHRIHFLKRFRWVAAAIFIGIMVVAAWFVFRDHSEYKQNSIAETDIKPPSANRAMITLANGQKISLDSVVNGKLAMLGNIKLEKLADGRIAYTGTSDKVEYNTITNPRGSKVIDMAFVDGSHVWLNAGSSITYPVPFEGSVRKVKISGEAYFEITRDASKPFKVVKDDMEVTVLGTHFNVNAFDDETETKITLLEGSVKVTNAKKEQMIKPGEQAIVTNVIKVNAAIDTEQVMAWKNGLFSFSGTELKKMMKDLERWYDVKVEIQNGVSDDLTFSGKIGRDLTLSQVLTGLKTMNLHFVIEPDKKIMIMP